MKWITFSDSIDSLLCRFVRIHICAVKCSFQNWGLSCLVTGCIRLVWICAAYNDFPFLSILSGDFSPPRNAISLLCVLRFVIPNVSTKFVLGTHACTRHNDLRFWRANNFCSSFSFSFFFFSLVLDKGESGCGNVSELRFRCCKISVVWSL